MKQLFVTWVGSAFHNFEIRLKYNIFEVFGLSKVFNAMHTPMKLFFNESDNFSNDQHTFLLMLISSKNNIIKSKFNFKNHNLYSNF